MNQYKEFMNSYVPLKFIEGSFGPKYVKYNNYTIDFIFSQYGTRYIISKNGKEYDNFIENIYDINVYGNNDNNSLLIIGQNHKNEKLEKIINFKL